MRTPGASYEPFCSFPFRPQVVFITGSLTTWPRITVPLGFERNQPLLQSVIKKRKKERKRKKKKSEGKGKYKKEWDTESIHKMELFPDLC